MSLAHIISHPVEALDAWWVKRSPERRLDRNAANICMLIALMGPALTIALRGPSPASVIVGMPKELQVAMCSCIFIGLAIKLHGALMGSRFYFPRASLKRCYRMGYSGAPAAVTGLGVYACYLFRHTPDIWGVMTALTTPMLGIGVGLQAVLYWLESRRIERNEQAIIDSMQEAADEHPDR